MKKIAIIGQHFAVTAALGYLEWAAKRLPDYEIKTIGPFHGNNMPWGVVSVVSDSYILEPDIAFPPMPIGDSSVPFEMVEAMLGDWKPDLWLTVDAGFRLTGKPEHGINAVFYTDPHVLRGLYDQYENNYDYRFNPQTVYSKPNEYYLPYAADSIFHRPLPNVEKVYDVTIIGNYYQNRVDLINNLRSQNINCFFQLGLAKQDAQYIMNQSKICVNWSSLQDMTARVFETMGTGICLVANRVPDLVNMFEEDKEYIGFDSMEECTRKIVELLADNDRRETIAKAGLEVINTDNHFWDARLQTILEVTGVK